MTGSTANLIIEHLKALRTGQDEIRAELKEIKVRLTHLEGSVLGIRRDTTL